MSLSVFDVKPASVPDSAVAQPIITHGRTAMPSFEQLDDRCPAIRWVLQPGDALVFTQRTLHAAPGNPLAHRRRSANLMLLGDDATYDAAAGETHPPFKDENLADGAVPRTGNFLRLR